MPRTWSSRVRVSVAVSLAFVALIIQSAFWSVLHPFAWFLFYPAVFIGSWIGGVRSGLATTALSTVFAWLVFIPPRLVVVKDEAKYYLSAAIFIAMGVLFSLFHGRLRSANLEIRRLYEKTRDIDQLKTRLYARVSHELRTPLALVLGPTERWIGAPGTSSDLKHDLEIVARNARLLLRHIDDLLDVAKLEARAMTLDYSELDVTHVLRLVSGLFEVLAEESRVVFTVDAPASLVAAVDPDKLRRILQNLLSNAFKFTPAGGTVRIALRPAGSRFVIEVADSGPGIPADRRDVVFEPFRQLDDSPTRRFGGTGLGLAIVRELVVLHRGSVAVREAPEGGALFVVELPLAAPPGSAVAPRADEPAERVTAEIDQAVAELRHHVAPPPDPRASGPIVLVVEDNAEMSELIARALSGEPYRVLIAGDGRSGLAMAIAEQPDLIITDVMMPELSGDALVRAVRQRAELDTTAIVVLTAKADDALRVELLRSGADDFLVKPFLTEELRARVRNLVARRRAEEQTARLIEQIEGVAEANTAVSEAIAGLPSSSLRAVLQTIALKAQTLTGARYAAVGIGTDPAVAFDPWVFVGVSAERIHLIGAPPRPVGLLGLVARGDEAVRVREVASHPASSGLPPHHPPLTSFLGVPIRYRAQTVGNLYLASKLAGDEFTEQDQCIVEMLAARVGSAIETARLYRDEGMERAWLQAVVDQMPDGVVLLDAAGQVTAQNRAALRLCRSTADPELDLVLPDGRALPVAERPGTRALTLHEAVRDVELLACRADGARVPVLVSAAPVHGPAGELAGATMVVRDISAHKQLERLREEWAAIVAHDLQQPVNAILLGTELALRGQLGPRERSTVERIRGSTARLSRMIQDLKEVSALETQRLEVHRAPLDVAGFAREVAARCVDIADRIDVRVPEAPVMAACDPGRLEQVLSNLLSNAGKYGDEDEPIGLSVERDGDYARIAISNRGPGIAAEDLATLFDRYVRTQSARRSRVPGSGLGLYIARGLVEAQGGRIWATSSPGELTTFQFTLPIVATDGPPARSTDGSSAPDGPPARSPDGPPARPPDGAGGDQADGA